MTERIQDGQLFEVCEPHHYPHRPHRREHGCYSRWHDDKCSTVHVRIWFNVKPCQVPPSGPPNYDGNADFRVERGAKIIIVPGSALIGTAGIFTMNKESYVLIVDDLSAQPMGWYLISDWSFCIAPLSQTTNAVDWVAFRLGRASCRPRKRMQIDLCGSNGQPIEILVGGNNGNPIKVCYSPCSTSYAPYSPSVSPSNPNTPWSAIDQWGYGDSVNSDFIDIGFSPTYITEIGQWVAVWIWGYGPEAITGGTVTDSSGQTYAQLAFRQYFGAYGQSCCGIWIGKQTAGGISGVTWQSSPSFSGLSGMSFYGVIGAFSGPSTYSAVAEISSEGDIASSGGVFSPGVLTPSQIGNLFLACFGSNDVVDISTPPGNDGQNWIQAGTSGISSGSTYRQGQALYLIDSDVTNGGQAPIWVTTDPDITYAACQAMLS